MLAGGELGSREEEDTMEIGAPRVCEGLVVIKRVKERRKSAASCEASSHVGQILIIPRNRKHTHANVHV